MSGLAGAPELMTRLSKAGVEFIVVGGVAGLAHGGSRLTQDIDIVYARDEANLVRIVRALQPLKPYLRGAPPGLPFEWSARTLRAGLNFTLRTNLGDLDLLGEITGGGSFEDLRQHSVAMRIFNRDTLVLDLPWLIKVKRAAGRVKDLEAIAELEVLRELRERA